MSDENVLIDRLVAACKLLGAILSYSGARNVRGTALNRLLDKVAAVSKLSIRKQRRYWRKLRQLRLELPLEDFDTAYADLAELEKFHRDAVREAE
jgi:hypothetical protein